MEKDSPSKFQEISLDVLKNSIQFILQTYRKARNGQVKSGKHEDFSKFAHGKSWVVYMHTLLVSIGDPDLFECVYAELEEGIKLTSDQPFVESSARAEKRKKK